MGLRATKRLVLLSATLPPADLIRLCPGCDTPLADVQATGDFAIQHCPQCGLSMMSPR